MNWVWFLSSCCCYLAPLYIIPANFTIWVSSIYAPKAHMFIQSHRWSNIMLKHAIYLNAEFLVISEASFFPPNKNNAFPKFFSSISLFAISFTKETLEKSTNIHQMCPILVPPLVHTEWGQKILLNVLVVSSLLAYGTFNTWQRLSP